MVTELDSVNPDKVHLGLVLGCNDLDLLNLSILVLSGSVDEEVSKRLVTGCVDGVVLAADLGDGGNRKVLKPLLEVRRLRRGDRVGVGGSGLVEGTVYNNGRGSDALCLCELSVSDGAKQVVVTMLLSSSGEFRGRSVGGGGVENGNDFVSALELVELVGGYFRYSRERLPERQILAVCNYGSRE